jgi:hypothetical protein
MAEIAGVPAVGVLADITGVEHHYTGHVALMETLGTTMLQFIAVRSHLVSSRPGVRRLSNRRANGG